MFGLLGKLQALLTAENADYLDTILSLLVEGDSAVYTPFWRAFNEKRGKIGVVSPHAQAAWNALSSLRSIVKEYQREQQ